MEIQGNIHPKAFQRLPKKYTLSKRFTITKTEHKKYEACATVWIPDIPYSKFPPGVAITLHHGTTVNRQWLRLVFANTLDLLKFFEEIHYWIGQNLAPIKNNHNEALDEWKQNRKNSMGYNERLLEQYGYNKPGIGGTKD